MDLFEHFSEEVINMAEQSARQVEEHPNEIEVQGKRYNVWEYAKRNSDEAAREMALVLAEELFQDVFTDLDLDLRMRTDEDEDAVDALKDLFREILLNELGV